MGDRSPSKSSLDQTNNGAYPMVVRRIYLLVIFFTIMASAMVPAAERDILEIAEERPPNDLVGGNPKQYGDPDLEKAVHALADIPHPWTVPTFIELFRRETSSWLQKLQGQIDKKSDQMWEGWRNERDRCGYLATVLAASRDPRAAMELGKALDTPSFPGATQAVIGLNQYFLPDPKYHRLERMGPIATTNILPYWEREVRQWWNLNKDYLAVSAKALSD
jgi:hypothetical protein